MNYRLEALARTRDLLDYELYCAKDEAVHTPIMKVDRWTQLGALLAILLAFIAGWPFVESLEWGTPAAVLATMAIAALEVLIATLLGFSVHALVMDEPDSGFCLSAKQHQLFLVSALFNGAISVAIAVLLASKQGYGGEQISWLIVGLGVVALGAYGGAALHDNRFQRAVNVSRKRLRRVEEEIDRVTHAYRSAMRQTMATAYALCSTAAAIDERAGMAYIRFWRLHHRRHGDEPALRRLPLPTQDELHARLLITMYGTELPMELPDPLVTPQDVGVPRARVAGGDALRDAPWGQQSRLYAVEGGAANTGSEDPNVSGGDSPDRAYGNSPAFPDDEVSQAPAAADARAPADDAAARSSAARLRRPQAALALLLRSGGLVLLRLDRSQRAGTAHDRSVPKDSQSSSWLTILRSGGLSLLRRSGSQDG